MSLSPTAAAAAIARPRWSSSRDIPTTCAACKHRAEAQGESRHATEDRRRAREGLRFDGTLPRTSRSSMWMKSEAPTSLETELDLDGDSVAVAPALKSLRERIVQRLQPWPPQTTGRLLMATRAASWLQRGRQPQLEEKSSRPSQRAAELYNRNKPRWPPPTWDPLAMSSVLTDARDVPQQRPGF